MLVSPSLSRISVLIERLPNVGSPPYPVPDRLLISTFNASVTSSLWWMRGVMSMLTPMLR